MEKYVSINQYEGGFVVVTDEKTVVATSLNKAIKLIREHLASSEEEAAD